MSYIGQSVPRVDATAKVKGEAVFASDRVMPGQAYLKMLMAHRPHAIVRRVDTSLIRCPRQRTLQKPPPDSGRSGKYRVN